MITLKNLRSLAALADTLHFHRAAERCHISQPAFSAQIAQLEEALGVALAERSHRRVLLTPVGREVAERAKRILRDIDDLADLARQGARPLSGTLRLGVLPTLGSYLLPHILPDLRRAYPELRLYLREEPAMRALQELERGDLDLALVSLPESEAGLVSLPLFHEPFWAALPLGHGLGDLTSLAPQDLAGQQLLLLEAGHCMRDQALALCKRAGASEHPDFRATSLDSLRQMVATGLGVTLLPALYVAAEALGDEQIVVRPFADPPPTRLIGLVWRRTSVRAAEFRLLADLLLTNLPAVVTRSS